MSNGKINPLLVFFSGIGGLIGFAIGELILYKLGGNIPSPLLIGLYFGQLALFIGLMCLLAEIISPKLNGHNWKMQYASSSWLHLVPATLVMLFVGGALLQFIYQLDGAGGKRPNDILMVMDISGSMAETDPNNDRLYAASALVDDMKKNQRVGVIAFDHETYMTQPMTYTKDQISKDQIKDEIMELYEPMGGTEIGGALDTAMEHIKETRAKGRKATVILLSDGYSHVDLDQTLSPYIEEEIVIHTIGLADPADPFGEGIELLRQIADYAQGQFYDVEDSMQITEIMHEIYKKDQDRWLVGERYGSAEDSLVYRILRIIFLGIIGLLIGLSIGIVFDNRYLAKAYIIGGIISGIIAGIILEFFGNRFIAALCLGVIFTLFSIFADMKNEARRFSNRSIEGGNTY